jgi:4-amino-4-deoxy-L-arabinose transferase-like glycosyltransferase
MMKPVRLPASATLALPRWAIFALCLLYILPGLLGRDPWKNDDAASFGIMWTMAHDTLNGWLTPNIVGLPMPEEGPLAFWLGALAIKCFGFLLGEVTAARIASICAFLLGATSIWYSAYLLGRRNEAQPLKLAFGGQPNAHDYGRTLAVAALLIYLGCWGLLLNSHQTSAESLQVALVAFVLYRILRYMEKPHWVRALTLGAALAALALTRGWWPPLVLWLMALPCLWLTDMAQPDITRNKNLLHMLLALAFAVGLLLLWRAISSADQFNAWWDWNCAQLALPNGEGVKFLLRYGIWFYWPAWPFAAWAVYAWRRQRYALHIAFPFTCFVGLLGLTLLSNHPSESLLLPMLPPLVILAAFGLPTMKRGAINAVDWFAVMAVTVSAALIWLAWAAHLWGWPAQLAKNTLKLAPGFKPEFHWFAFIVAASASIGWVALVYWRISRQPSVLWRAVVLSSGGLVLCWLLLMTLFLPWVNYRLSYEPVAKQIAARLPRNTDCIVTNVSPAQRASFAYFGNLPFAAVIGGKLPQCKILLLQDHVRLRDETEIAKEFRSKQWQLLWEGRRAADRDERFRLYRRRDE